MKVLVVDDKEESRYLLETLLKGSGYHVESASQGIEALEKLQSGEYGLIISDILMPVMDGFQLCRKVKSDKILRSIPLILLTSSYTGPQDEDLSMKVGADKFVRKPCEPDELMQIIKTVLKDASEGKIPVSEKQAPEEEILKLYSARLVRKLEQKMLELEQEVESRKKAEEALRISNTRLQLALASSNIGLWSWNLETDERWFSSEWKRQIGYTEHETIDNDIGWRTLIHPEDKSRILAAIDDYLEGHSQEFNVNYRIRHKDGSYRWIIASGEKIIGKEGEPIQFTGCHVDITRYMETLEALEAEKNKFQTLIDESPFGVALLDREDHVQYLNPRFTEIFKYTIDDISSRGDWFMKAYPDIDYRNEIISLWNRFKETADPGMIRTQTRKVKCKDGSDKLITIITSILTSGDQIAIFNDITEQRRLEEKLQQAQKMEAIGTLAGGIAHDFNNILSAVIGYAELAKMNLSKDNPVETHINKILTAGSRAEKLVKHILAFSRQTEQKLIPLEIHLVVKEVLSLLRSTLPTTIEIRLAAPPSGTILGDPTQIHQVIMNLCTNAYHAMRDTGGVMEVSLKQITLEPDTISQYPGLEPGNYIKLSVSDTGSGISPEIMERIFDPYFTTKNEGEGTGLGLSVVHGIVNSHKGTITVYSEPGKGSVFHVYLPQLEQTYEDQEEFIEGPLPTGHERILFIDDEPALATLGKQIIETMGYKVTTRTSGIEALELFRNKPDAFDLVITDMTMPKMTGSDLAQELMKIRPDIPIILCTGFSYTMSENKAKTLGIREFVMKPLVRRDLANIIRKVLDGSP